MRRFKSELCKGCTSRDIVLWFCRPRSQPSFAGVLLALPIMLLNKARFVVLSAFLALCACVHHAGYLTASGVHEDLVGQTISEVRSGFVEEARRSVGRLADPAQVLKDQVGNAKYEIWQWSVHDRFGAFLRWDWLAFRDGVAVQVGSGPVSASGVESAYVQLRDFGRIDVDKLDDIRKQAIEQSRVDPICGLVKGPQYGERGMVAIIRAPAESSWKYMSVVVEYRDPKVLGEVDFYMSPTSEGAYSGVVRLWSRKLCYCRIMRMDVRLTSRDAAVFRVLDGSQTLWEVPLRLLSHEARLGEEPSLPASSSGTGWIEEHGLVVTNLHVVKGADRIAVDLADGRSLDASLAASDPNNDLALLRISGGDLPIGLATRREPAEVGEDIIALGYPLTRLLGDSLKMGRGSVSSAVGLGGDVTQMQIDAPVHPGNSGGPVLSMDGKVVGVVVARVNDGALLRDAGVIAQNINYAIKASYIEPLWPMVKDRKHVGSVAVARGLAPQDIVKAVQGAVVKVRATRAQ